MRKLNKLKEFIDTLFKGFTKCDFILVVFLSVLFGISYDFGLNTCINIIGNILLFIGIWYLLGFILFLIYLILEKRYEKKSNIEKLIDNELGKDK